MKPLNAMSSIILTLFGILISLMPVSLNECWPIISRPYLRITLLRFPASLNAAVVIALILFGIVNFSIPEFLKQNSPKDSNFSGKFRVFKDLHPLNASHSIILRVGDKITSSTSVFLKHAKSILYIPCGTTKDFYAELIASILATIFWVSTPSGE